MSAADSQSDCQEQAILRNWDEHGVEGSIADIREMLDVLSGEGCKCNSLFELGVCEIIVNLLAF